MPWKHVEGYAFDGAVILGLGRRGIKGVEAGELRALSDVYPPFPTFKSECRV